MSTLAQLVPFYLQGPDPRGIFTKRWAVRVIVAGRLNSGHVGYHSRQSVHGKGSNAQRRIARMRAQFEREAQLATAEWFDSRLLTERDVDALAEQRTEGRTRRYLDLPIAVNFNE